MDQAAERLGGGFACGGGADDVGGETFEAQGGTAGHPCFGDAVGVEGHAVARLQGDLAEGRLRRRAARRAAGRAPGRCGAVRRAAVRL
ncbi:hypothetical protein GCM10010211_44480 [Streptomyces albospinus]|uniref:Uncharacterized protein n=1 Tax=Streptomyces albospinus TaxID=285515 RepID=A0ABQ2V833_9ACTN|nr:hypothetical protein GCM10010211_44480 [Streptomyces albospinus]